MTTKTRRRVKLVTTFVAMIVTLCMTCFGIMAAISVTYTTSGSIILGTGKKVAATIRGEYQVNGGEANWIKMPDESGDPNEGEAAVFTVEGSSTGFNQSVVLPDFTATGFTDEYTFTFTVQNDLTSDALKVQLNANIVSLAHLEFVRMNYVVYETGGTAGEATPVTLKTDGESQANSQSTGLIDVGVGKTIQVSVTITIVDSETNKENGFGAAAYTLGLMVQRPTA